MAFVQEQDLNYDTRLTCLVNVDGMLPGDYGDSSGTSEMPVLADLMKIVNKSFTNTIMHLRNNMKHHVNNRIRIESYSVEHRSGDESDDFRSTESDLLSRCLRFAIIMETFRKFIQDYGMMFISGDFVLHSDGQPDASKVSGFSRLQYEPTPITVIVDSSQDIHIRWSQSVYFDNPSDELMGLHSTPYIDREGRTISQPDGNLRLIINRDIMDDPFIHDQELRDHVFCASTVRVFRGSPSHGRRSIDIDMQLGLDDLLVMCNEMLLRMGMLNPFELLSTRERDADDNSLYLKVLFKSFMKYARRCVASGGVNDPRAVIIVLAIVCLMEYDQYRPLPQTVPGLLVDQYCEWLGACTGSWLRMRSLTNTLGNFYLLKSSLMSNMLDVEFDKVVLDHGTRIVPLMVIMTLAVRKMLMGDSQRLHKWALQVRLPGMDVHELLVKYALQDYQHLYLVDMDLDVFRLYLDVLRWYKPDFKIPAFRVQRLPPFPVRRFTQEEAQLLREDVPDFSDFRHVEVDHTMMFRIQRAGIDRQRRLLHDLGYSS